MCCSSFLKIMMFVFNGIIFLAGAIILGVGIWLKVDSGSLLGFLDSVDSPDGLSQLANISYLLIVVGAILLVIGFLGCCGAIRESRCMLLTFFCIVLIIFLVEVAGAIVLLVFQDAADSLLMELEDEMRDAIRSKYGDDESMSNLWNATMTTFQCCGYRNYTDFTGSPYYNDFGSTYPPQCCNATVTPSHCDTTTAHLSNIDGCFDRLLELLEENAVIVAGVALGIAGLEIAAMVVSMVLYKSIGNKD